MQGHLQGLTARTWLLRMLINPCTVDQRASEKLQKPRGTSAAYQARRQSSTDSVLAWRCRWGWRWSCNIVCAPGQRPQMVIWRRGRRSKACLQFHVLHLQGAALGFFSLLRTSDEQAAGQGVWEMAPGLEAMMTCTCCSPWAGGGGGGTRAGSSAGGGGGRGGSIDYTSNEKSCIPVDMQENFEAQRSPENNLSCQTERWVLNALNGPVMLYMSLHPQHISQPVTAQQ